MAMTAAEPTFVDTNVLVYATRTRVAQNAAAVAALAAMEADQRPVWISRQVMCEYAATMTLPTPEGRIFSALEVARDLERLGGSFLVADETSEVTRKLRSLLVKHDVKGRQVHDANIVATMLANQVARLLTFNVADFRRFEPLIALEPLP